MPLLLLLTSADTSETAATNSCSCALSFLSLPCSSTWEIIKEVPPTTGFLSSLSHWNCWLMRQEEGICLVSPRRAFVRLGVRVRALLSFRSRFYLVARFWGISFIIRRLLGTSFSFSLTSSWSFCFSWLIKLCVIGISKISLRNWKICRFCIWLWNSLVFSFCSCTWINSGYILCL